ncbi:hypothetical protein MP228_005176 [Amoeboaphelidium protococcarum]|nr:hypothetical protein MP228_005176 [Amoeboaphelidium protococcarum]
MVRGKQLLQLVRSQQLCICFSASQTGAVIIHSLLARAVSQSVDEVKSHPAGATVATQGIAGFASDFADCSTPTERYTCIAGPSGPDSDLCPVIAPLMPCSSDIGIYAVRENGLFS